MIKRITYQDSPFEVPHSLEMPDPQRIAIDWKEVARCKVMTHCINEQGGAQNAGNIHCERGRLYLCFVNTHMTAKLREIAFRLSQLPPDVKLALLEHWPQIWIVPQPVGGYALSVIAEIELDTSPKVMKPLRALARRKERERRAAEAAKRKQMRGTSKGLPKALFDWGWIRNKVAAYVIGGLILAGILALLPWIIRLIQDALASPTTP